MFTRSDINKLGKGLQYDLNPLRNTLKKIVGIINLRKSKILSQDLNNLLEAKRLMESSVIHLQNIISPKINKHTKEFEKEYNYLVGNMGRWNKKMDNVVEDITNLLSTSEKIKLIIKIKQFREGIIEGVENLVYNPLLDAQRRIQESNQAKDMELFGYFVFFSLSNSTFILAPITREEGGAKKRVGTDEIAFSPRTIPSKPRGIVSQDDDNPEDESETVLEYYSSEPSILSESEDD